MEREGLFLEVLAMAMAAHNSGGLVIVQVERLAEAKSLNPRRAGGKPWGDAKSLIFCSASFWE